MSTDESEPIRTELLGVADMEALDLPALLASAERQDCKVYYPLLHGAANAPAQEDPRHARVAELLADIACPILTSTDKGTSYQPMLQKPDGSRTILPADFTHERLDDLEGIAPNIPDVELRARALDILWIRRRRWNAATEAISAYLDSAQRLLPSAWPEGALRIRRATELAKSLGKSTDHLRTVLDRIDRTLDEIGGDSGSIYLSLDLLRTVAKHPIEDLPRYASRCRGLAMLAGHAAKWGACRELLLLEASLWRRGKPESEANEATILAACTHVFEALNTVSAPKPSYFIAAQRLRQGLDVLRNVPGTAECRDSLHRVLLEYEAASVNEFGEISGTAPVDFTPIVEEAVSRVAGRSRQEGIAALAFLHRPSSVAKLREQVLSLAQRSPLRSLISAVSVDGRGKVISKRDALFAGDDAARAEALTAEMFSQARLDRQITGLAIVQPALERYLFEQGGDDDLFWPWLDENVFVPTNRISLYRKGLNAGARGEWEIATHLLVPQIEHSLRFILQREGIVTSGLDPNGIQREHDLARLLDMPEIEERLGVDLTFELRGLLTESHGSAIRHGTAHGLLDSDEFQSPEHFYLWWITLHLVVCFRLGKLPLNPQSQAAEVD